MGKKDKTTNIVILIILFIVCWPAAIVWLIVKKDDIFD